jgi:hypothetical protein
MIRPCLLSDISSPIAPQSPDEQGDTDGDRRAADHQHHPDEAAERFGLPAAPEIREKADAEGGGVQTARNKDQRPMQISAMLLPRRGGRDRLLGGGGEPRSTIEMPRAKESPAPIVESEGYGRRHHTHRYQRQRS